MPETGVRPQRLRLTIGPREGDAFDRWLIETVGFKPGEIASLLPDDPPGDPAPPAVPGSGPARPRRPGSTLEPALTGSRVIAPELGHQLRYALVACRNAVGV